MSKYDANLNVDKQFFKPTPTIKPPLPPQNKSFPNTLSDPISDPVSGPVPSKGSDNTISTQNNNSSIGDSNKYVNGTIKPPTIFDTYATTSSEYEAPSIIVSSKFLHLFNDSNKKIEEIGNATPACQYVDLQIQSRYLNYLSVSDIVTTVGDQSTRQADVKEAIDYVSNIQSDIEQIITLSNAARDSLSINSIKGDTSLTVEKQSDITSCIKSISKKNIKRNLLSTKLYIQLVDFLRQMVLNGQVPDFKIDTQDLLNSQQTFFPYVENNNYVNSIVNLYKDLQPLTGPVEDYDTGKSKRATFIAYYDLWNKISLYPHWFLDYSSQAFLFSNYDYDSLKLEIGSYDATRDKNSGWDNIVGFFDDSFVANGLYNVAFLQDNKKKIYNFENNAYKKGIEVGQSYYIDEVLNNPGADGYPNNLDRISSFRGTLDTARKTINKLLVQPPSTIPDFSNPQLLITSIIDKYVNDPKLLAQHDYVGSEFDPETFVEWFALLIIREAYTNDDWNKTYNNNQKKSTKFHLFRYLYLANIDSANAEGAFDNFITDWVRSLYLKNDKGNNAPGFADSELNAIKDGWFPVFKKSKLISELVSLFDSIRTSSSNFFYPNFNSNHVAAIYYQSILNYVSSIFDKKLYFRGSYKENNWTLDTIKAAEIYEGLIPPISFTTSLVNSTRQAAYSLKNTIENVDKKFADFQRSLEGDAKKSKLLGSNTSKYRSVYLGSKDYVTFIGDLFKRNQTYLISNGTRQVKERNLQQLPYRVLDDSLINNPIKNFVYNTLNDPKFCNGKNDIIVLSVGIPSGFADKLSQTNVSSYDVISPKLQDIINVVVTRTNELDANDKSSHEFIFDMSLLPFYSPSNASDVPLFVDYQGTSLTPRPITDYDYSFMDKYLLVKDSDKLKNNHLVSYALEKYVSLFMGIDISEHWLYDATTASKMNVEDKDNPLVKSLASLPADQADYASKNILGSLNSFSKPEKIKKMLLNPREYDRVFHIPVILPTSKMSIDQFQVEVVSYSVPKIP